MIKLKINFKYCLAFYSVIMLYVSMHELIHHFVGRIVCGAWGTKSFNSFETACLEGDNAKYIATFAGPIFTYLAMYYGMWLLQKKTEFSKQLGFAVIFAQLPAQRMMGPFMGFNDEYYAAARLLGGSNALQWGVGVLLILICLPPLIKAFKSIQNRRRWLWFAFYFLLFPYILWGPMFGLLEYLMLNKGVLDQAIIGIGLLFIINELVTIVLYFRTKHYIVPNENQN